MQSLDFSNQNFGPFISSDGTVVGGDMHLGEDAIPGFEAIRWTADTGVVRLGLLSDTDILSTVRGLNVDGSRIVGFSRSSDGIDRAYIWTEATGMQDLQQLLIDEHGLGTGLEGWELQFPQSMSPNGRFIVGCIEEFLFRPCLVLCFDLDRPTNHANRVSSR